MSDLVNGAKEKNNAPTESTVEKLKRDLPELCSWVSLARSINEMSAKTDSFENTQNTMQTIVEILACSPRNEIVPTLSQRKGWVSAVEAKDTEVTRVVDRVNDLSDRVVEALAELQNAEKALVVKSALVQKRFDQSLQKLDQLAESAGKSQYEGPSELDALLVELKTEAENQVRFEMATNRSRPPGAQAAAPKRRKGTSVPRRRIPPPPFPPASFAPPPRPGSDEDSDSSFSIGSADPSVSSAGSSENSSDSETAPQSGSGSESGSESDDEQSDTAETSSSRRTPRLRRHQNGPAADLTQMVLERDSSDALESIFQPTHVAPPRSHSRPAPRGRPGPQPRSFPPLGGPPPLRTRPPGRPPGRPIHPRYYRG